ncbi:cytochrome P450 [Crossiella sp. SN42]|uniref:cytochrome P450 n=1 Tax=Crossiella sp. SN42 TaxID=2944808 RepID=UPI00207CBCED|nr:cytochrome P450 [Crossiella sp. SN42]MCO1577498.1 cytochrome P450 [Crossiella sp. SN42]
MTTTPAAARDLDPIPYPFNEAEGLGLSDLYEQIRNTPGMLRVRLPYGEPAWLATRYADARFVLGDKRFSRAMAETRDAPRAVPVVRPGGILGMDPPDHTRLRTLAAKGFTMRRVEALRPRVAQLAEDLVAGLIEKGPPADLVEEYALPIPVVVICELLGVPPEDRPQFRVWSDAALSTSGLTPQEMEQNQEDLRGYMSGLIAEHRERPRDDLMTALIEARDVGDRLTELELVDLCVGILVAGHETTATQIPNFLWMLLEHPDQLKKLRAEPELIPNAVEELLRFVPLGVGASFPRYATEDVQVGEVLVKAGEPVLVSVGSANRDALKFTEPGVLDVTRTNIQHLGFGHGVHHCLGAMLARMELQEALRVLLARLPGLHLAGDITWKNRMIVRGPKSMPIAW